MIDVKHAHSIIRDMLLSSQVRIEMVGCRHDRTKVQHWTKSHLVLDVWTESFLISPGGTALLSREGSTAMVDDEHRPAGWLAGVLSNRDAAACQASSRRGS